MIAAVQLLLASALGFGFFRVRGMHSNIFSGQISRLVYWALPYAIFLISLFPPSFSGSGNLIYCAALLPAAFAGIAAWGWGKWTDLGNVEGDPKAEFYMLMLRGFFVTFFAGCAVAFAYGWAGVGLAFSGVLMAPAYWLGWRLPSKASWLARGTEWGEGLYGCFLWDSALLIYYLTVSGG